MRLETLGIGLEARKASFGVSGLNPEERFVESKTKSPGACPNQGLGGPARVGVAVVPEPRESLAPAGPRRVPGGSPAARGAHCTSRFSICSGRRGLRPSRPEQDSNLQPTESVPAGFWLSFALTTAV